VFREKRIAAPIKTAIIIVDDDEVLLETLTNGLAARDFYCEATATAKDAIERIGKASFDVMVMDVILPDENGVDLTKKMTRLHPEMKIILMTGYADDFSYDEAIKAGASDFIKKPFTLKELVARINNVRMQDEMYKSQVELRKKVKELEDFYNMAVGRELRMKELKKEIVKLKADLEACKGREE